MGNLFVADGGTKMQGAAQVYKFTPAGVRTTFALGLTNPDGLAFDSAGNLFVAEFGEINGGPGTGRSINLLQTECEPLLPPDCVTSRSGF